MHTERIVGGTDEVVVLAWQTGRRKTSGGPLKNLFGTVFKLEDSKIKWARTFWVVTVRIGVAP
jgi:hypothetical protein